MPLKQAFATAIATVKADKVAAAAKRVIDATPVDTGAARDSWVIEGDTISSNSKYISELNNGYSDQAPSFFIERAILADVTLKPNGTIVLIK